MIPIQLTIEGIYSYQKRQTIDFTELTEANLFGIFGSVGSGKSSILEAITYALYGETERLNARDKRSYNMMNLKSNQSYIEFDFQNFEGNLFRVTREFKRNSKNFNDVKSPTVAFYELKNEQWIPIENPNIEQIIGLSYKNFKRTIIIPQGQFKEFLELGDTDRTNMMKEIFNLHQYDLQDKVRIFSKKNELEISNLSGQLAGFETVSQEIIEEKKKHLAECKTIYEQCAKNHETIQNEFQKLQKIKDDFSLLQTKSQQFEKLKDRAKFIQELEEKVNQYEKIYLTFYQVLENQKQKSQELNQEKSELTTQKKSLDDIQEEFNSIQNQWKEIQIKFEKIDSYKTKLSDLQIITKIKRKKEEIKTLKARTEKGFNEVYKVKKEQNNTSELIQKIENQIENLSKKLIEDSILMDVEKWFFNHHYLLDNQTKIQQNIIDKKQQIHIIENDFKSQNIDLNSFKLDSEKQISELDRQEKAIDHQINHLLVQQKLANFTHDLHDDQPCPLCGSLEHPNIVEFEDVSNKLKELETEKNVLQQQKKNLQELQLQVEQKSTQKKMIDDQLNSEESNLKNLQDQLKTHLNNFTWKEFHPTKFEEFQLSKTQNSALKEEIKSQTSTLKETQEKLKEVNDNLEKYQNALQQFKIEEAQKNTEIQSELNNLKQLQFDDFETIDISDLLQKTEKLSSEISNIEKDYKTLNQKQSELTIQLATQNKTVEITKKRILEIENELNQINETINQKLAEHQLDSVDFVLSILNKNINIAEKRREIQVFQVQFEVLKNEIEILKEKLDHIEFDEELYENTSQKLQKSSLQLKSATEEVAKISTEIERLEKEFLTKENLLKEFSKLQNRAENLKIMTNLFKAAGFVQYVSAIHLRHLCDNANLRFHRMTRNQLSLQLNENNDFEIIDFLNEGKSRSVKTLSGGQAFQASLSLALALAESVQANAQAEKNFFFIDEGFGTQDLDSVNIVFETLSNLVKENRIVGIISHVEELKERIPKSLTVVKDPEKGSLIEIS